MTKWTKDAIEAPHTQRELDSIPQSGLAEHAYWQRTRDDKDARIAELERELAAEKALEDRLRMAGNSLGVSNIPWREADEVYRKARGL